MQRSKGLNVADAIDCRLVDERRLDEATPAVDYAVAHCIDTMSRRSATRRSDIRAVGHTKTTEHLFDAGLPIPGVPDSSNSKVPGRADRGRGQLDEARLE